MFSKAFWVKFPADDDAFPGAHRSPDGRVVGILTPTGWDAAAGVEIPARINVVTKDRGTNLVEIVDCEPRNVTLAPGEVEWTRATVPGDCPIDRVRHLLER